MSNSNFTIGLKASKAALISFYKTLRIEFGIQIGITIVTPGLIETDDRRKNPIQGRQIGSRSRNERSKLSLKRDIPGKA